LGHSYSTLRDDSCNRSLGARFGDNFGDPDATNEYFANIANDAHYDSRVFEKLSDYLPASSESRGVSSESSESSASSLTLLY
jgi:hypothetical protein